MAVNVLKQPAMINEPKFVYFHIGEKKEEA